MSTKTTLFTSLSQAAAADPNLLVGDLLNQFDENSGLDGLTVGEFAIALGASVRKNAQAKIQARIVDVVSVAPGMNLAQIAEAVDYPSAIVGACLRSLVGKDAPLAQIGDKKGAQYFPVAEAPTADELQDAILAAMRSAENPLSKPKILKEVSGDRFSTSMVENQLSAMLEAGVVSFHGNARGRVWEEVKKDETAIESAESETKTPNLTLVPEIPAQF